MISSISNTTGAALPAASKTARSQDHVVNPTPFEHEIAGQLSAADSPRIGTDAVEPSAGSVRGSPLPSGEAASTVSTAGISWLKLLFNSPTSDPAHAAPITTSATAAAPTPPPTGISALVYAIVNGTFKPSFVTDPGSLVETTPRGSFTLPSMSYASDATAQQMAQLLGGTVVKKLAFPLSQGWQAPLANFIKLPGGQMVNAGDLATYARFPQLGIQQLTADITQEINQGAAISKLYDYEQAALSGQALTEEPPDTNFKIGDPGPAIAGMIYPEGTLAADGSVINPGNAPLYKT